MVESDHFTRMKMKLADHRSGLGLVELLSAVAILAGVIAGSLAGVIALQKSFAGYTQYAAKSNNGSRMIDYVTRDLRNAIGVARRDTGTATAFKTGALELTEATELVVSIPDYYQSNVPDRASGSTYKTPRFSRSALATGKTTFTYDESVEIVGTTRVPRFPGKLEVRYLRRARSAQDATLCYFRQEYDGSPGVLRSEQEIAEKVQTEKVTIQALAPQRFRVVTSFTPRWSGEAKRAGTVQFAQVTILNPRRD
jgi:hypothetical protein